MKSIPDQQKLRDSAVGFGATFDDLVASIRDLYTDEFIRSWSAGKFHQKRTPIDLAEIASQKFEGFMKMLIGDDQ